MKTLHKQLSAIANMSDFVRQTGIPRRTIDRIKNGSIPAPTTRIAIIAALRDYKPSKP